MPKDWVKLDSAYYDHPKMAAVSPMAELLYVRSIAWSGRNRTDGRLTPKAAA